jgi:hypothetical protein
MALLQRAGRASGLLSLYRIDLLRNHGFDGTLYIGKVSATCINNLTCVKYTVSNLHSGRFSPPVTPLGEFKVFAEVGLPSG